MKRDVSLILIAALIGLVIALILTRGCGNLRPSSGRVDVVHLYDSIERVIRSQLPPPDTIEKVVERDVVRWLPGATIRDTILVDGETIYIYNNSEIDTNAILRHFLTQAVTYIDTVRDSSLQAIIQDTIFRNKIAGRGFTYKILRPVQYIDHRDKFQLIASFQAGGGMTYANVPSSIYAGVDLGFKFKSGTYFSFGYMAGSGHFMTIRAGQVIRFKKYKPNLNLIR